MLYLPESASFVRGAEHGRDGRVGSTDPAIEPRSVGQLTVAVQWQQVDEIDNPLGVVPLVPMLNNADTLGGASSEVQAILPLQDAVNKLLADMMIAREYSSFRQRWGPGSSCPSTR